MRLFLLILTCLFCQISIAADIPTLYASSINWDNVAARTEALESSHIPKWDEETIRTMHSAYLQSDEHQLPALKNEQKYNTLFLDAYWGPTTNPFVKYSRPAKIFVYLDGVNRSITYMAPIIQNAADGNFYVFTRATSKPLLLTDWITEIKSNRPEISSIKFTVCTGYGNLPTDSCMLEGYEKEALYALNNEDDVIKASFTKPLSASRAPNEDWHKYYKNSKSSNIVDTSISWADEVERNELLSTIISWPNYKIIQENFEKLRDLRYFNDKQKNGFLRRVSWLYPDDGCWTRASAIVNHLFGVNNNPANQFTRPSKVFAFGNLCANTPNNKDGRVDWWYHTAPIVRDAETGQAYVLDPSINPYHPMKVENWMTSISANDGACHSQYEAKVSEFNTCNGFGNSPYDHCKQAQFDDEAYQALGQRSYQVSERNRQIDLNRDPDKVLGDEAPWMK